MLSLSRKISLSMLLMFVCTGSVCGIPRSVRADSAVLACRPVPAREGRRKAVAGDLFARGEKAFAEKDYLKALKRFLCSLHTIEHEATVTNIHEIVKVTDNREVTVELLDAYIEMHPDGEMTSQIQEIRDSAAPEEDTEEAPPEPAPIPEPEPVRTCVSVPDIAPFQASVERENRMHRLFGLAGLGSGAAFIVAGAVFQGLSAAAGASADEASSYDDFISDIERKKQFQAGAIVGFATGAVTAGIGIATFVTAKKRAKAYAQQLSSPKTVEHCTDDEETKTSAVPKVSAGVGAFRLTWSF